MSTLAAMLVVIISAGMIVAYHVGYSVGYRDAFAKGRADGKREGSVRAYAVGYDRGRHNRKLAEEAEQQEDASESSPVLVSKFWVAVASLVGIVMVVLAGWVFR